MHFPLSCCICSGTLLSIFHLQMSMSLMSRLEEIMLGISYCGYSPLIVAKARILTDGCTSSATLVGDQAINVRLNEAISLPKVQGGNYTL